MATILRSVQREFKEDPNKKMIDGERTVFHIENIENEDYPVEKQMIYESF
jgi:hypothetical protein